MWRDIVPSNLELKASSKGEINPSQNELFAEDACEETTNWPEKLRSRDLSPLPTRAMRRRRPLQFRAEDPIGDHKIYFFVMLINSSYTTNLEAKLPLEFAKKAPNLSY